MNKSIINFMGAAALILAMSTGCAKHDSNEAYEKAKQDASINTSIKSHDENTHAGTNIECYSIYDQLTRVENLLIIETYYDIWSDPAGNELSKRHKSIISAAKDLGYTLEDIKLDNITLGSINYKKATYKFKNKD